MKIIWTLVACIVVLLVGSAFLSHRINRLRLEREIELAQVSIQRPTTIVETTDNRYLIAGVGWHATAVKVDGNGNVLWEYQAPTVSIRFDESGKIIWENEAPQNPNAPQRQQGDRWIETGFYGAVAARDGGVLLCGTLLDHATSRSGIIVRLDRDGHEVSRVLYYQYDFNNGIQKSFSTQLNTCGQWGDGFVVTGQVIYDDPERKTAWGVVIMRLHEDGSVESQKLIQVANTARISRPQVRADGGLSLTIDWTAFRLDKDGELLAKKELEPICHQADRIAPTDDSLRYVCTQAGATAYRKTEVIDLGSELQTTSKKTYSPENMTLQGGALAYPDGALVLFGSTESPLMLRFFIPTVIEYAADGSLAATYRFFRPWSDGWFVDGIATEQPDVLAGLRWKTSNSGSHIFVDFLKR